MFDFVTQTGRLRGAILASAGLMALAAPGLALAAPNDAAAGAAAAADAADAGDAIVVTARHRDENLQNVPLAISTVNGKALATEHLDRVADYAIKVPNFSALQQNTRVSALYIRGVGGNASNDGAESGVGLIVDNVFFTHVGFSWLDFVDLDSIEVVRGPQGTLLGKNTTIGAVIVNTAKPSFTPELNIAASYGNHNAWQIRTNATGPLTDRLAYRLTFATSQGGGWITNAYDRQKYLGADRWSLRGQLLWKPAAGISDRLIAEHYNTEEYNNFYPPVGDVNENLTTAGAAFSPRPGSFTNKLINLFGYTPSYNAPHNANLDNQQPLVSRTDGISNELNVDIGPNTLTAVTAWRRLYFRPYNDGDFTPLPIDRNGYDVDVNQYSQELRFASRKGGLLEWTLGAYGLHEKLESRFRFISYGDAASFFTGSAATPSSALDGVEYDKDGRLKVDSGALFGQATLNLTNGFSITGGVRYTRERKQVTVVGSSFGGAAVTGVAAATRTALLNSLGGTTGTAGGNYALAGDATLGSAAWLVNPTWKVNPHIRLYASASYGQKSGAANTAASAAQAAVILTKPEKSMDFEGGVKTSWWHDRLVANLNLYNNTITDYQGAQIDPTNPSLGNYLANVGKVRLRGFELETTAEVAPGITLNANAAYNDARYLSYANAPAPLEYQAYLATIEHVAAAATTVNLTGYQIVNAPKWIVQAGVHYDRPIGQRLRLTGYADTSWRSRVALINPLSVYGWQGAYAIVNAGLGVKSSDDTWTLQVWSKNLFDKHYAATFAAASALNPVLQVFGDPRSFGVTLSYKFRP